MRQGAAPLLASLMCFLATTDLLTLLEKLKNQQKPHGFWYGESYPLIEKTPPKKSPNDVEIPY